MCIIILTIPLITRHNSIPVSPLQSSLYLALSVALSVLSEGGPGDVREPVPSRWPGLTDQLCQYPALLPHQSVGLVKLSHTSVTQH